MIPILLTSGFGMIIVAALAVVAWRGIEHSGFRWFWIGAALWTVAVALKVVLALLTNAAALGFFKENLNYPLLVACGGLYVGIQSSVCEMGITLLAARIWPRLGKGAGRAIAIGIGAGAFEAFLLGLAPLAAAAAVLADAPGSEQIVEGLDKVANVTPLVWLAPSVERMIAILCHASTRALILLGAAHHRVMMIFWGFAIFTALDGIVGAVLVSGKMGTFSTWWIELAILPFALISIPILRWCYRTPWPEENLLANQDHVKEQAPGD